MSDESQGQNAWSTPPPPPGPGTDVPAGWPPPGGDQAPAAPPAPPGPPPAPDYGTPAYGAPAYAPPGGAPLGGPPPGPPGYPPPGAPVPPGPPGYPPPGQPGQPGYPQGYVNVGYPPQPAASGGGLATAALVLGIVGVCLFWIPFLGPLIALVGLVLGVVGMGNAKKANEDSLATRARIGLILGIVGLVGGTAFTIWIMNEADDVIDRPSGMNSDPSDGRCNFDRIWQDPDC